MSRKNRKKKLAKQGLVLWQVDVDTELMKQVDPILQKAGMTRSQLVERFLEDFVAAKGFPDYIDLDALAKDPALSDQERAIVNQQITRKNNVLNQV
ncbi:hypothetical protein [Lacticaseibacillus sp. GG6-2]